ncbi:MAG: DegT/DnrJ/EryC1/StrS family aminotransferase [bacterium]|nr:DegT/DnrJ/EryC1/StrS family aminotransferase [bacterium]
MYIIGQEEADAVRRVIESKQLFRYRGGEGGETDQFEADWAATIGVKHVVAVTSGTAALTCALAGMNIGPGDEVIVPAYTWIATPLAAVTVGAIPIIAEVDESLTLDPADVERKITPRTKAIIPVHMSGYPANMDALTALADKHGLMVLEDACQADGGSYKGRRLGSIGIAGAHSFNHYKIMSCGEGGAVVTNDETVYQRALVYHDIGAAFRDHAEGMNVPFFAGTNYRINEILSAILRVQLTRLDGILAALRKEKAILRDTLSDVSAFSLSPVHDIEGDCGTVMALLFDTAEAAKGFVEAAGEENVDLSSPIDSGIHVYSKWRTILEKQGAHHPARNPFATCGYEVEYSKDMCPKTLEYLARTVYIATSVDRSEDDLRTMATKLRNIAEKG